MFKFTWQLDWATEPKCQSKQYKCFCERVFERDEYELVDYE